MRIGHPEAMTPGRFSKLLAVIIVMIMVASSAIVVTSFQATSVVPDPENYQKADSEANGAVRSLKYEISRIGDSYLKPTDYSMLGRSDHTQSGINQWYITREANYNDTIIHDSWPFVIASIPYPFSVIYPPYGNPVVSWIVSSFYQLKVDAENITGLSTGAQSDPWIIPILHAGADPDADDGGWVNMSLYQSYLTDQEVADIKTGEHYANTFYGVPASEYKSEWGGEANDGWFTEIQGHWDFSRRAAHKFLGLPGTGDLVAEFNAVGETAIATAWENEWIADGDVSGPLDIYTAYEFSLKTGNGPVTIWVKLDSDNSTSDKIALWMWSQTWGGEYLLMRYLDASDIYENLIPSRENWYLNGTFCPANGDIHEVGTTTYHMTAWNDKQAYNNPTWMLEPQHMDILPTPMTSSYTSRYDPYAWTFYGSDYKPTRLCLAPGIAHYGQRVRYWQTPMNWNLTSDEALTIKLPSATQKGWGVEPYWANNYSVPGNAALEIESNGQTGEFVLGHGHPATLYSTTYYDPVTKTITIPGGTTFDPNMNPIPGYSMIFESGSPRFYLDISPVSHYNLSIVEPGPYSVLHAYTLRVTPRDVDNSPVRCNQTVLLPAVAGVTYGASSHTFAWGEDCWETNVTFGTPGDVVLVSEDQYFYLDIVNEYSFKVGFTWNLYQGWNLVSNPLVGVTYRASTLGLLKADIVADFNSSTRRYDRSYIVGASPVPCDFDIVPGVGYWIYVTRGTENITLFGTVPSGPQTMNITVPLGGGWAQIGLCSLKTTFRATNLTLPAWPGGRIVMVAAFDNILKNYTLYFHGGPPRPNFYLIPGNAYWVFCAASLTITYDP